MLRGPEAAGLDDVPVVVGGIIPDSDARRLREQGVARVFTPKDFGLTEIMGSVVDVDPRGERPRREGAGAGLERDDGAGPSRCGGRRRAPSSGGDGVPRVDRHRALAADGAPRTRGRRCPSAPRSRRHGLAAVAAVQPPPALRPARRPSRRRASPACRPASSASSWPSIARRRRRLPVGPGDPEPRPGRALAPAAREVRPRAAGVASGRRRRRRRGRSRAAATRRRPTRPGPSSTQRLVDEVGCRSRGGCRRPTAAGPASGSNRSKRDSNRRDARRARRRRRAARTVRKSESQRRFWYGATPRLDAAVDDPPRPARPAARARARLGASRRCTPSSTGRSGDGQLRDARLEVMADGQPARRRPRAAMSAFLEKRPPRLDRIAHGRERPRPADRRTMPRNYGILRRRDQGSVELLAWAEAGTPLRPTSHRLHRCAPTRAPRSDG